ncbi:MAG: hypothetical protein R2731_15700 [Nocardioides sp.]
MGGVRRPLGGSRHRARRPGLRLVPRVRPRGPLVVEIGSGVGEATAALAAARPDVNVLAFEVWRPGVAATLARLAERGVGNVRLSSVDAVWALGTPCPRAGSPSCGRSSPIRGTRSATTSAGW